MLIEGVLPVLKPVSYTSHDVVAKVRRMIGIKRIGHTGTLDPDVTGVLPLCIGRATRVVEYIQDLPKEYEVKLQFGRATDTEDWTGNIIEERDHVQLSEDQITTAVNSFLGEIEQIPPMYSAVKVAGQRLYELARQGKEIERKPRRTHIYKLVITGMNLALPFPELAMQVKCSKGTYIRTLCVDIGKALGCPAVMTNLVRTSTGNIELAQCLSLAEIERLHQEGILHRKIISTDQAIKHFPAIYLDQEYVDSALQGRRISLDVLHDVPSGTIELLRVYGPDDTFIGVYRMDWTSRNLLPVKVFLPLEENR